MEMMILAEKIRNIINEAGFTSVQTVGLLEGLKFEVLLASCEESEEREVQ